MKVAPNKTNALNKSNKALEDKKASRSDKSSSASAFLKRFKFIHAFIMILGIVLSLRVINLLRNFIGGYGASLVVSASVGQPKSAQAAVQKETDKPKEKDPKEEKNKKDKKDKELVDNNQEPSIPLPGTLKLTPDLPLSFGNIDLNEQIANYDPLVMSDSEIQVLKNLRMRREQLEKTAIDIKAQYALLEITERRVDEKLKTLESLKKQLEDELKKEDLSNDANVKKLVKTYEGMKPQEAARAFNELPLPILKKVLEKMSDRKIAPIMNNVNPERVRALTVEVVRRSLDNEARRELIEGNDKP